MNTVQTVLENEAIIFGLFGLTVVGLWLYVGWLVRRWSWIPRKRQRREFMERF